jgi:hypothetical protein
LASTEGASKKSKKGIQKTGSATRTEARNIAKLSNKAKKRLKKNQNGIRNRGNQSITASKS